MFCGVPLGRSILRFIAGLFSLRSFGASPINIIEAPQALRILEVSLLECTFYGPVDDGDVTEDSNNKFLPVGTPAIGSEVYIAWYYRRMCFVIPNNPNDCRECITGPILYVYKRMEA